MEDLNDVPKDEDDDIKKEDEDLNTEVDADMRNEENNADGNDSMDDAAAESATHEAANDTMAQEQSMVVDEATAAAPVEEEKETVMKAIVDEYANDQSPSLSSRDSLCDLDSLSKPSSVYQVAYTTPI